MQLTKEEEQMLAGKQGWPVQKSMEILVQLGEIYGAEKMIKVSHVHMPGSSVVVAGEAGTKFVEKMASLDGKFCASTTLNPGALNFDAWEETGYSEKTYKLQRRLTDAYVAMGAVPCHTCTPYLIGDCPRRGDARRLGRVFGHRLCQLRAGSLHQPRRRSFRAGCLSHRTRSGVRLSPAGEPLRTDSCHGDHGIAQR